MPHIGGPASRTMSVLLLALLFALRSLAQSGYPSLNSSQFDRLLDHARRGNIDDQFNVGVRYQYGFSIPRDVTQAEQWLRHAASLGNTPAQLQLGLLYLQPEMLAEHGREAMQWFIRASASGQPEAEFNLGLMYLRGLGIAANLVEAEHWLRRADRHHVKRAKAVLATLLLDSPDPQRQREGFILLRKASKDHDPDSRNALGYCYEFGIGTPPDLSAAVRLYQEAAKAGNSDAMHSLGVLYHNGKGVPLDFAESFQWSKRGCDAGDAASCWSVGALYLRGEGVPKDPVLAYSYLGRLHGNPELLAHLDPTLSPEEKSRAIAETTAWEKLHAVELSCLPLYADRTPRPPATLTAAGQ